MPESNNMSGPDVVRIKRKRSEQAPDALLVERPGKRQNTELHYVRRKDDKERLPSLFDAKDVQERADSQGASRGKTPHAPGNGSDGAANGAKERRTFHLKRPSTPEAGVKKRKAKDEGIATFIEKRAKRHPQELLSLAERGRSASQSHNVSEVLKRPGKSSAVRQDHHGRPRGTSQQQAKVDSHLEAMAISLHQFAIEETAKESPSRPKVTATPRLPPQRSKELHRQRASRTDARLPNLDGDADMDDETEYVYDTYVLAPNTDMAAAQVDAQDSFGNVGYLVITEEDQAVWETYIEDEPSDKDWNSDEDDENAEDWYGADYPDDELASDDEYNRNAYGYHAKDEEWNEDTGSWSDEEYERQMQPWRKKMPQQLSKYLDGK